MKKALTITAAVIMLIVIMALSSCKKDESFYNTPIKITADFSDTIPLSYFSMPKIWYDTVYQGNDTLEYKRRK